MGASDSGLPLDGGIASWTLSPAGQPQRQHLASTQPAQEELCAVEQVAFSGPQFPHWWVPDSLNILEAVVSLQARAESWAVLAVGSSGAAGWAGHP